MNRINLRFFLASLIAGGMLLGFTPITARADLVYYSDGSDISGFVNEWDGVGHGGTVQSTSPFLINGISQGRYIAATSYPMAFLSSPVAASAPGIWVGVLMQAFAPDTWAAGINLSSDTALVPRWSFGFAAGAGWWGNSMQIALADPNYSTSSGHYKVTDGQSVAVLAHFYDTGGSGTFNTGDLYVDPNLADGISFGVPIVNGFTLGAAVPTIGSLRLGADPTDPETRYYDNIVVAGTQAEALGFLETGVASVPEPSLMSLLLLGTVGFGGYTFWNRRRTQRAS